MIFKKKRKTGGESAPITHHLLLKYFSSHWCSFGKHSQSGFISQTMPLSSPWAPVNKLGPSLADDSINDAAYF